MFRLGLMTSLDFSRLRGQMTQQIINKPPDSKSAVFWLTVDTEAPIAGRDPGVKRLFRAPWPSYFQRTRQLQNLTMRLVRDSPGR